MVVGKAPSVLVCSIIISKSTKQKVEITISKINTTNYHMPITNQQTNVYSAWCSRAQLVDINISSNVDCESCMSINFQKKILTKKHLINVQKKDFNKKSIWAKQLSTAYAMMIANNANFVFILTLLLFGKFGCLSRKAWKRKSCYSVLSNWQSIVRSICKINMF